MVATGFLGRASIENELSCNHVYEALWLAASQPIYIFWPITKFFMEQLGGATV